MYLRVWWRENWLGEYRVNERVGDWLDRILPRLGFTVVAWNLANVRRWLDAVAEPMKRID
jgi:hypothetical protein